MKKEEIYKLFKLEVERFYVNQFIDSENIDKIYLECISCVLDNTNPRGAIAYHSKYGQGKTFLFNVLHSMCRKEFGVNIFKQTSSKELIEIYKTKGEDELLKFISCKSLFIDDVGAEVKDASNVMTKNYGNALNVVEYVIFKRYELWEKKGFKLHATTNIDIKQMSKLYGGRVADRLSQMCEIVLFDTIKTTFRQVKSIRPLTQFEKEQNMKKYYPAKTHKIERVDMIEYFNDVLKENPESIMARDIYHWTFIREYFERHNMIEYTIITDGHLQGAESLARKNIRDGTNAIYKNADNVVARREKEAAYDALDHHALMNIVKNVQVRNKFIEMQLNKSKFKTNENK